jgi:hypothetical protein
MCSPAPTGNARLRPSKAHVGKNGPQVGLLPRGGRYQTMIVLRSPRLPPQVYAPYLVYLLQPKPLPSSQPHHALAHSRSSTFDSTRPFVTLCSPSRAHTPSLRIATIQPSSPALPWVVRSQSDRLRLRLFAPISLRENSRFASSNDIPMKQGWSSREE